MLRPSVLSWANRILSIYVYCGQCAQTNRSLPIHRAFCHIDELLQALYSNLLSFLPSYATAFFQMSDECPRWNQNGYLDEKFQLFDETNGEEGWDYNRMKDHKYILAVMINDPVVGLWAASSHGGHRTNKNNSKLFDK